MVELLSRGQGSISEFRSFGNIRWFTLNNFQSWALTFFDGRWDYSSKFFIFQPSSFIVTRWTIQITYWSWIGYGWLRSMINLYRWFPPPMDGPDSFSKYYVWICLQTETLINDSYRRHILLDDLFWWMVKIHCRSSMFEVDCGMKLWWLALMNGKSLTSIYSDERLYLCLYLTILVQ
jgi:hypothetical protein